MRALTDEEARVITKLAHSQTAAMRLVERARIIELASQGNTIPQIIAKTGNASGMVRKWFTRFSELGLAGLEDAPRSGAPSRYTPEAKAQVIQVARTRPQDLGLAYASWTFERLTTYVREQMGIRMKKTRIFEILHEEGLRWRKQETWFGERLDPEFAQKRGPSRRSAPQHPQPV
jgi:transposase